MKPEFPKIDQDRTVAPHAQEIEYALILSRMINTVKEDPAQMRMTIYEFARARLTIDTSWADESEQKRLLAALETAIQGVEEFSMRREEKERLQPPNPSPQIAQSRPSAAPPSTSVATLRPVTPAPEDILMPERSYLWSDAQATAKVRTRTRVSILAPICIGMLLLGVVAGLAHYRRWADQDLPSQMLAKLAKQLSKPSIPGVPSPPTADPKTAAASSSPLPFPLPSDYGVYALNNSALSELNLLPERVPDKRIAMSTPISEPSRTTLSDGNAKFVIFRRDIAGNAPERVEVRVVARVMRVLTFDARGKPTFSPISDSWNIRNVSYEFRVRPIAGEPEMLLVQSDKADLLLPAGRYVLVLREQGYDFTVAGKVTEPSQCVERTEAANGTFYSECQK
jgi:hypothetical protein